MKQLTIIERIKEQEELARKFHEVESRILTVLDFDDLCQVLVEEIAAQFGISYVWLVLAEECEAVRILCQTRRLDHVSRRLKVVSTERIFEITRGENQLVLVNENLGNYGDLWPRGERAAVRSLAMTPIFLDQQQSGFLLLADPSVTRFRPGLRTDFLERLGLKVSICLSNVTAHEKLKLLAYRDPLTGLYNRRIMETVLKREMARARRYDSALSVVFIDLNDFKVVNDRYGHDCGDTLLKYLAEAMLATCRDSDLVSRYAGDEFVLVLPETSTEQAGKLIVRIQSRLEQHPLRLGSERISVSLSYGIASPNELVEDNVRDLLRLADQRLYAFKREHRESAEKPSA